MESTNYDLSGKTDMVNPHKIQTLQATEIALHFKFSSVRLSQIVVLLFIIIIGIREVLTAAFNFPA